MKRIIVKISPDKSHLRFLKKISQNLTHKKNNKIHKKRSRNYFRTIFSSRCGILH
jgi:hypothetical protein